MTPNVKTFAFDARVGGYRAVPLDSMPGEVIRAVAEIQKSQSLTGSVLIGVEGYEVVDPNPWAVGD